MESLKSVLRHPSDFHPLLKLKIAAKQAEKNIPTEPNLRFCNPHHTMESIKSVLTHPSDFHPLLKLKIAAKQAEKNIPTEPNLRFCYAMLPKVSKSFSFVIQHLGNELRDAVCIFYLVLRALDTIEDDTSIDIETKIPILIEFHRLIYNPDWHFECGTKQCKVLVIQFYNVSKAFLELNKSYQKVIEDTAMKMGVGMAKFVLNEVDTINDYDEYCHYAAGLVGIGLSKLFHASGKEISLPDPISNSVGLFLQKANIIRDFHEDINEVPKPLIFWPREIWSKYADKFEDLRHKDNSEKALECLNDMVTNALLHIEDCLKCMSDLRDPAIFRSCAIPQIMAIGTLALCYNNIKVFRGVVKMRPGLMAKVIDRTKTMADVYGAFYDFSLLLESKIDSKDPNAKTTFSRIQAVQKVCRDSGTIDKRESYIAINEPSNGPALVALLIVILAILYAYLHADRAT